jgi:hypothetical protein
MAFTGYKALDFSGIDKAIQGFQQRQQLASLGQNLDGTPEGYAKAAQALLQKGDVNAATNFFALSEKARERSLTDLATKNSPFAINRPTPTAPSVQGVAPLASLGMPTAPAQREFNRPVQVAETEEDTQRLEAEMAQREGFGYGNPTLPAGMRNNNPGNIKFVSPRQAPGVVGPSVNTDQGDPQAVFNSPEAGMSAAYSLAMRKYQGGKRTALDLIAGQNGWTPGNTAAAANIARGMGVAPNEDLRLDDPQRAQAFMRSLIAQEHGQSGAKYPPEMIQSAIAGPAGQAQPSQVAQAPQGAPAQPGAPVSDVPVQGGAEVQGNFTIPGPNQLPPNDPRPDITTPQLLEVLNDKRQSQYHAAALEIYRARQKYSDENAPEKRALTKAQAEKTQLELEQLRRSSGGYRNLVSPEERASAGIPADDKRVYQLGPDNKLYTPPGGTTVNNSIGASESEYAKANGKAISGRFEKIVEEGDVAALEAGVLSQLRTIGGRIKNMGTGAAIQARLAEIGIKVGENVSEIEAYGALIDKLTPQQKIAGAGATSDFDARMFKNSLPGLMKTPGGNEIILSTLEALNTYKRQRADIVAEAMARNQKPADVLDSLKQLPDPFAAFKEARKGATGDAQAPARAAPPPAAAPPPQRPAAGTPRTATNPNTGERIMLTPDGQWVPYS